MEFRENSNSNRVKINVKFQGNSLSSPLRNQVGVAVFGKMILPTPQRDKQLQNNNDINQLRSPSSLPPSVSSSSPFPSLRNVLRSLPALFECRTRILLTTCTSKAGLFELLGKLLLSGFSVLDVGFTNRKIQQRVVPAGNVIGTGVNAGANAVANAASQGLAVGAGVGNLDFNANQLTPLDDRNPPSALASARSAMSSMQQNPAPGSGTTKFLLSETVRNSELRTACGMAIVILKSEDVYFTCDMKMSTSLAMSTSRI
jgi:hypothetical protein